MRWPCPAPVPDGTSVKVLSRQGGWTQVEMGASRGWVRVFHLRFPGSVESTPSSSGGDFLSSLGSAITGQRSNTKAKTEQSMT